MHADTCGNERDRLVLFYEKYNPSKLEEIDKILEAYEGQSDLLYQRLFKKYNIPMKDDGMSGSDISLLGDTPFDFVSDLDSTREATGQEDHHLERERLVAFYEKHNPAKLLQVDQILKAYKGDDGELKKLMTSKSPSKVSKVGSSPIQPQLSREQQRDAMRHRLASFFKVHNPSQVGSVDQLLDSYRGRENLLFRKLRQNIEPNVADTQRVLPSSTQTHAINESQSNANTSVALNSDMPLLLKEKSWAPGFPLDVALKLPSTKESKCPLPFGQSSPAIAVTPIPSSRTFVSPVDVSASNPFAPRALNRTPLTSRKTDFFDRFPISHKNPFSKSSEAPAMFDARYPERIATVPFSSFRSVSSSGSQFLENMKASKDNPFAKPTSVASPLTKNASSFLRQVKPSMNNPFAPGSPCLTSKPPILSIGLDSRKVSSRATEDALSITDNLIIPSTQLRQAVSAPKFVLPPPREGSINAATSLTVSATSNAASIPVPFESGLRSRAESSSNASSTPPKQALKGRSSLAAALAATPTDTGSKTKDYSFETWYSESDDDEISHVEAPVGRVAVASDHGNSGLLVQAKAKGKK